MKYTLTSWLLSILCCLSMPFAQATDLTVLTNSMVLDGKRQLIQSAANEANVQVRIIDVFEYKDSLADVLQTTSMVVIDLPRASDMQRLQSLLQEQHIHFHQPTLAISRSNFDAHHLTSEQAHLLHAYYRNGGRYNMNVFFQGVHLLQQQLPLTTLKPVKEVPIQGAYHPRYPEHYTSNPDLVLNTIYPDTKLPVIAIGFHVRFLESDDLAHIDQLVKWVEEQGAAALPVFYPLGPDSRLPELLPDKVNALIHLQPIFHNGLEHQLNTLGIPVLQGISWWNHSIEHWEQDPVGLPLASTPLHLSLPEQNGLIDPLVFAAEEDGRIALIDYQAKALIRKAYHLSQLQRSTKEQQKFAVMVYNYPPGQKSMSASFLNVPRTLEQLSKRWHEAGYQTEALSEQTFIDTLGSAIQQRQTPPAQIDEQTHFILLSDYEAWFSQLPEQVQERITTYWGEPSQSSMLSKKGEHAAFAIPTLQSGNIVYLAQPSRSEPSSRDNESVIYHDIRIPINHYYLATYLWVREHFQADALIHLGTHGTQEWIAGKERGLSVYDDSYLVLGDMPIIYPYIIDDVGEAVQAKRRGRAVMISHQTPPFQPAGLHGTYLDTHQNIHQWENLDAGEVKDHTLNTIVSSLEEEGLLELFTDDTESIYQDPEQFILDLHEFLNDLAMQSQPIGLHTFTDQNIDSQKLTTVMLMLGDDFLQALQLDDSQEVFVDDYEAMKQTKPYQWLESVLFGDAKQVNPQLPQWQKKAYEFYGLLDTKDEWANFYLALQGKHVTPGIGGDPIRTPDSLPSGKNLVGFDAARVPTKEAWLAGKAAAKALLQSHFESDGQWPQRVAFSLWGIEAMRHGGILESQAFYAMGVEPTWDQGGRVNGFRIIPQEELQRPRVDVVLSVTGLYRDQFPNVMEHLAKAAAAVSMLKEPNNPLHEHTQIMLADLLKQGIDYETALPMAQTRVFGSPTGVYGSGIEDAILASDTWEDEGKLANLYLQRMSHAFGPDSSTWSEADDYSPLYAENLKTVDIALLARTSNTYGMLTSDDPFQYLGGIDLAVRHLTGRNPTLYISNQRQAGKVRFQRAEEFLAVEMATRAFHPGWIKAMQEEGFAGALNLQEMTNNLWGWQVVSPDVVKPQQWQKMHDIYVMDSLDLDMQEWFENSAPEAQFRMIERMLEAIRKDYWDANESTQQELVQAYMEHIQHHNFKPMHDDLAQYAEQLATGFGLVTLALPDTTSESPTVDVEDTTTSTPQTDFSETQYVEGNKLEQSTSQSLDVTTQWWWLVLILLPLLAGSLKQFISFKRNI